ncbi:MltA domain-containing protein [Sulfurimonas sp. HSL3-7]|uniref:murein transglycosylase A n=1 Tax=Sulfonitrofixus jiaomeiensis TaxID=3131938 RepID=UPI0031F98CCD
MSASLIKSLFFAAAVMLISGCAERLQSISPQKWSRVNGTFVTFGDLAGWQEEAHGKALQLFRQQCRTVKPVPGLEKLCSEAEEAADGRAFFEEHFRPFLLHGGKDEEQLLTGYYEPQFKGSLQRSGRYRYPLYSRPADLLDVKLDALYPDLKNQRVQGRLEGNRVVPYYSRRQINAGAIRERPLFYLESDVDRFFLQVQGSGRILLENNETLYVGYGGTNGHPYRSVGKALVASGEIAQEKISLQNIRRWLEAHPEEARATLESNPSFVFFEKRRKGATGSLGIELTPMRSVAVDRSKIPLGYPLFLSAADPLMQRIVFAQDTGGAIKGTVRADLFCGFGREAELLAGELKSPLRLYLLVPKYDGEKMDSSSILR